MRPLYSLLSILFMPLTLGAAYVLDHWISIQRSLLRETFQVTPSLVLVLFSFLLLIVIWILLSWWTLGRSREWYVSLAFILVGLVVLLYPFLRLMTGRAIFPGTPIPETIDSRLSYTAVFVTTLGAISWLLSKSVVILDE
jgi:apolipoprotein N-acyltransferase